MRCWLALLIALTFSIASHAQQRIIYDDDCSQDVDCVATLPILYQLEDRGEIRILAMLADSANPLSAPVLQLFATYGGHPNTPIGTNSTDLPSTAFCAKELCNRSKWTDGLVARFDAGDTRANYSNCAAVYRKVLAGQPDHSVDIVATGFTTCLNPLLVSPPDAFSPLSGADLVKRKVKLLSVMGGRYPAGAEWNFECDAPGFHALFAQWTRQNGFPPVYLNGFANGLNVLAGAPASASPIVNPTRYAMQLAGTDQRPMWDMLSALFAARGLSYEGTLYFTESKPGTLTIDANSGADVWSDSIDSGHYLLTNAATNDTFSALFDGYTHSSGFLAHAPAAHIPFANQPR